MIDVLKLLLTAILLILVDAVRELITDMKEDQT